MSKHHQQNKARPAESQSNGGSIPTYEDIQRRAYQIHEEKGGSDLENWLEAERVLKKEHQERR